MTRFLRWPRMRRRAFAAFLAVLTASLLPLRGESIQDRSPSTRLDLGFDSDLPGHEVLLPLSLDVPEGVEVGQAASEVRFPSDLLRFEEAVSGLSAQAVGAEVRAVRREPDSDSGISVVVVTVSVQPGRSIPSGVIAELVFTILEEAPVEQTVRVQNKPSALAADESHAAIEPVSGADGEILVTETPPVFACLFYMH